MTLPTTLAGSQKRILLSSISSSELKLTMKKSSSSKSTR